MYPLKMERLKNRRRWGRGAYSRNRDERAPAPTWPKSWSRALAFPSGTSLAVRGRQGAALRGNPVRW